MADMPPTQRRAAASGILAELGAEGFEDAREIGRGGFGVVYRCSQPDLDRVVAVKVLTGDLDPDVLGRFVREQQAMGRLSGHPHIVAVFQVGTTRGGHSYLVMPYHARGSLEQRIRAAGPLDWSATLRLGVKMSGALATAHGAGILHRDVKPANILITDYGEPELTDFGIARTPGGFRTTTGIVTGTPAFTAPEVLRGAAPTEASDLYGLGATLFCALTGHVAYERRAGEQVLTQFLRVSAQPVTDLAERGVPDEVRTVIEHAMATEPTDRPESAAALGEEIREAQRHTGSPVDALLLPSATPAPPIRETATAPPTPATKYRPPTPARSPLARKRLLDLLRAGERTRLISIHAPSGFGKTTLAAQWHDELRDTGAAAAWLTVDEDDNNLAWFLAHLVAALRPAVPHLADELDRVLDTTAEDPARAVLTALIDGLHGGDERVTVFLDDWQRVTAPTTVAAVRYLLDHGCHHLPIVVTSTARPELPLSRLRIHGELVEIGAAALRFDTDEVRAFLAEAGGVRLSREEAMSLAHRTDGWVAALQLAVLSLRAGEVPAHLIDRLTEHPDIGEFLAENVLAAMAPETLDFLMSTSLCERVCGDLAAELTGRADAEELLADICDRGMFLQRAGTDRAWFRYHQLFAGYLRQRLAHDRPGELPALHLRAADWFARHHLLNDAVEHALAANDPERAADLVEADGAHLLEHSKIALLQGILAKLPAHAIRAKPEVHLLTAWVNIVLRRPAATAVALEGFETALAEAALGGPEVADLRAEADVAKAVAELFADRVAGVDRLLADALARPEAFSPRVSGVAANVAAFTAIYRFDFDAARRAQQWAAGYHEESGPFASVYGRCFAGMAALRQLDLPAAEELFREALDTARATMGRTSHAARLACAAFGELRYETGDLDSAHALLEESRDSVTEGGGGVDFMIATYAVGARVRALRGDRDGARELLNEGASHAERLALPRLAARVRNEWVRLGFDLDPGVAEEMLRPRNPHHDDGITTVTAESDEDSAIRLLLADSDPARHEEAVARARALLEAIDADRRPLAGLRAQFLLGVALRRAGHAGEAERILTPATERCTRLGLSRLPLDAAAGTGD
ncbi:protein kinase [Nocardia puris]|uniref:serine/threonine-protein kinase n=1 Tax=Nocardia puris TaxID=208602 RepID=UPI0018953B6E|nr:serine/threonine-protein kinase [Nocardia puris]MBF6214042.1 protein kinase [Nocardia puris]MBF6368674.1 protein kinase [Nocardia puris]MBF6461576.1 protein kinase [Nocardia puris]